jgi:hypothetical protein
VQLPAGSAAMSQSPSTSSSDANTPSTARRQKRAALMSDGGNGVIHSVHFVVSSCWGRLAIANYPIKKISAGSRQSPTQRAFKVVVILRRGAAHATEIDQA